MIDRPAILQKGSNNDIIIVFEVIIPTFKIKRCRQSVFCSLKIALGSCSHGVGKSNQECLSFLSRILVSGRAGDREFPFGTMQHGVIRRITHATPVVARIAGAGGMAITFGGVIPITAIFLLLVAVCDCDCCVP